MPSMPGTVDGFEVISAVPSVEIESYSRMLIASLHLQYEEHAARARDPNHSLAKQTVTFLSLTLVSVTLHYVPHLRSAKKAVIIIALNICEATM